MSTAALQHLRKDTLLKKIMEETTLAESAETKDVYASLLRSMVSQQLSVKAAATIYGRFLDLFEDENPQPQALLNKSNEELRAVGLSRQKSGYMHNIAGFFIANKLQDFDWTAQSDTEIIKLLTEIKGVGLWTVQMILMFSLMREDVFPTADLGIQQAMKKLYGIDGKGRVLIVKMEKVAREWSPCRTLACRYLWKWKDKKS
jgi:DNA-3-methyladenine glycosylase II